MRQQFANSQWKNFFRNPHLYILLFIPLFCITFWRRQLTSDMNGYLDPWLYLGYFWDLKVYLNAFSGTYYGTRLPWILPGYLFSHLFNPVTAFYVLHLVFYFISIFALYFTLKKSFGARVAFFTAILMGCYFYFIREMGGSNYPSCAGIAFLCLTLWMLNNALDHSKYLILMGAFFACTFFSNMFLIVFLPILSLNYIVLKSKPAWLMDPFYFMVGFLGVTLLFCIINYTLVHKFLFYMPSVNFTTTFIAAHQRESCNFVDWVHRYPYLILIAIISFASIFYIIFLRKSVRTVGYMFQVNLIFTCLIYLIWQIMGHALLGLHYYTCYFIPFVFLAVGAQASLLLKHLNISQFYFVMLIIFLLSVLPFWISINFAHIVAVFTTVGVIFSIFHRKYFLNVLLLLFLGFAFYFINQLSFGYLQGKHGWKLLDHHKNVVPSYLLINDIVKEVRKIDPSTTSLFWYDYNEPMGYISNAVCSVHLWEYRMFNLKFPNAFPLPPRQKLAVHDKIFILTNKQDAFNKANEALQQINFHAKLLTEKYIREGNLGIKLLYIELV